MKKILVCFIMICMLAFNIAGVDAYIFEPPYNVNVEERLLETMPAPFSIDKLEKVLVAECDFNTARDSASLTYNYGTYSTSNGSGWSVDDGFFKIIKEQTITSESFALKYMPSSGLKEGDYYAFSCRIKSEDVSGGVPLNILEAYNSNWLAAAQEYNGKSKLSGSNDWYELTQILKVPAETKYLSLQANLKNTITGTVCFDDFKLYKIAMDPLETVLLSPNYKGLIFGDNYSDISIDVVVYEREGFYSYEDMYLDIRMTDESDNTIYSAKAEELSEKINFVFPTDSLNEGNYYLKVYLKDNKVGKIISKREHTIRKRNENYRPKSYVDENGHFNTNNEKEFVMRLVNWTRNNQSTYLSSVQTANEAGISRVGHLGLWWAYEDGYEKSLSYMRENRMKTQISLPSFWYSGLGDGNGSDFIHEQTDIPKLLASITQHYRDDDILDGYYIFDEPNPFTAGEEIRWNNEILAEFDIDHPTYGAADKDYDVYGAYTKMADIIGLDPYPITGKVDENNVPTDDFSKSGRYTALLRENFPNRPIIFFMQGFHYEKRGDLRSPNYLELRNMAWQSICEGAEGLTWYAYPEMTADATKSLETWKSELEELTSEIVGYEQIILSDEPAPIYQVNGGGDWLNIALRRFGGKTYVFAVNNTYENKSATVNIMGAENLPLSFTPLEVKLIEVEQDDFLSPEAELKYIGFNNGTEIFETEENVREKILYVAKDSGVINYTASISDNARLVIDGKEMPLRGKITVKNTDTFTVKVVAEDGITKTYTRYHIVKQ